MSRALSELLGAREPVFTFGIRELEAASGSPGIDIRLTAEMAHKTRQKIKELGLDPEDTTGKELYHALLGLVRRHDDFLAKSLGSDDSADVADLLPRLKAAAEKLKLPKSCWVIKQSTARKLLKDLPAKHVMKQLGYKSVDSMLKRENIAELYAGIRFAESPAWNEKLIKSYKKLTPGDFEKRDIQILLLSQKKWNGLAEAFVLNNRHNITHVNEMGVVAILPLPVKRMPGISIIVLPLLIRAMHEIRQFSAYCKLQQVKPNFSSLLIKSLSGETKQIATMAGQPIHWKVVHRYFSNLDNSENHPEIFEPHIQAEDLESRRVEEILYKIEPALKFWDDMDFVGLVADETIISFNLLDNAVNFCNSLPYGEQALYHFRESLWNEIFVRYMGEQALEQEVLAQLSDKITGPAFDTLDMEGI
jgi:hypothetical protein